MLQLFIHCTCMSLVIINSSMNNNHKQHRKDFATSCRHFFRQFFKGDRSVGGNYSSWQELGHFILLKLPWEEHWKKRLGKRTAKTCVLFCHLVYLCFRTLFLSVTQRIKLASNTARIKQSTYTIIICLWSLNGNVNIHYPGERTGPETPSTRGSHSRVSVSSCSVAINIL